ncbi:MAG TPA: hypothetical protein VE465_06845 [Streptosporangiaceae bacterium]|jgi:hypothetical protein|nr:hypothetical protein [Streptosporangiaceae bacterium]
MSNGARHGWGVLAGLILAPAIAAALAYGTWRTLSGAQQFGPTSTEYRIGLAGLALTAVVLAFAVASRLSPIASLIPGVALTALGGAWAASPSWTQRNTGGKLPDSLNKLDAGYQSIGAMGLLLMIGLLLLIASLFPARWRAREDLSPSSFEYESQQPYDARQPVPEPLPYEHAPQYGRPLGEEPPPFGTRRPPEEQPGFSTAPDWGTPRRDPNQM